MTVINVPLMKGPTYADGIEWIDSPAPGLIIIRYLLFAVVTGFKT